VSLPDLVVVGAGTMGAWTALHARRGGRSVTLLDAHGAGHSRATSGDETRIIRASHGPDAFYTRWSRRAREAWQRLGAETGQELFVQAGCLWFAHRDDGFEAAAEATLGTERVPVERVSPDEAAARWPQLGVDDLSWVLFEPEAGLLMARRAVRAAVDLFSDEGGAVEIAASRPGETSGRRLLDVVLGDGRRIAGQTFVFAAGPWLPDLFPDAVGDLIRVTKQDVFYIGPPPGDRRFEPRWMPCWVDYDAAFYGLPSVEGRGTKVAPDRYGRPWDPSSEDRVVDAGSVELTRRYLARRFPTLSHAPIVETRVCQYESTPDTHFVIDRHPELENVWLVGGGSGHGFKHGPVIGEHVVGRMDGTLEPPEDDRFSITRVRVAAAGMRTAGDVAVDP
jgi:glycine/D-amino acid oxidase-like deaminating enzyme